MTNYVLNYKIEDENSATNFLNMLRKKYPDHRMEARHGIPYFAFTARNLAGVEDNINSILDQTDIADSDYVALYYIREETPGKIKRLMVLGPANLPDEHLTAISSAEHENLLNDLFNIDFMRLRFQRQEK